MLTVNKLISRGQGLAKALVNRAPTVSLDWDTRQKSRFDATDSTGRTLGVFLPRGTAVRGDDVLIAEDGSLIKVIATPQPVLVVRACPSHGTPVDLLRAAYHLGNRHIQLEVTPDHLHLEPDHVLADMLRQMHLIVSEEHAPFEPEAGAYSAGGHAHGHGHAHGDHDHGHDYDHDHDEAHAHGHGNAAAPAPVRKPIAIPIQAAPAPHVHGPGCGHDHGHGHKHDH